MSRGSRVEGRGSRMQGPTATVFRRVAAIHECRCMTAINGGRPAAVPNGGGHELMSCVAECRDERSQRSAVCGTAKAELLLRQRLGCYGYRGYDARAISTTEAVLLRAATHHAQAVVDVVAPDNTPCPRSEADF
eukprot:3120112-Rhodomonas_salina.7